MVPIRSHTPITASIQAAVPSAMPMSPQNGTKCAWVRPKLETPQMAKVKASTQKVQLRTPAASA